MNNQLKLCSLLILLMFIWVGCKRDRLVRRKDLKLATDIVKNDIKFDYFTSRAKLKFSSEEMNLSTAVNLRIEKGKQIWASVMPMLGIEMIRAKITRDSVFIMNRIQKTYTVLSVEEFSKQFGANLDYDILEALIMGDVPVKDLEKVKLTSDKEFITLNQQLDEFSFENKVSRKYQRLSNLSVDGGDYGTIKGNYSDFEPLDQQMFAKNVEVQVQGKDQKNMTLEFRHGRIKKSKEPPNFSFHIPDNYERQ